jgi:hypothetical protein
LLDLFHSFHFRFFPLHSVLRIRIRSFFTPESGSGTSFFRISDPGSPIPYFHISASTVTIFWLQFFPVPVKKQNNLRFCKLIETRKGTNPINLFHPSFLLLFRIRDPRPGYNKIRIRITSRMRNTAYTQYFECRKYDDPDLFFLEIYSLF